MIFTLKNHIKKFITFKEIILKTSMNLTNIEKLKKYYLKNDSVN
jgi:hypothetical protein